MELYDLNRYCLNLQEAANKLLTLLNGRPLPPLGLVLGSGLGHFADALRRRIDILTVPYDHIPGVPACCVTGHAGELIVAPPLTVLAGRVHSYEGYTAHEIVFLVRVLAKLDLRILILTNAAGAIDQDYHVGGLVLIRDHICLNPELNPLRGPYLPDLAKKEFTDLQDLYNQQLRVQAQLVADRILGRALPEGVYAVVSSGRTYETPAEITMLHGSADLVGMSTIPEAIAAHALGVQVLAFSLVTNFAAGTTKAGQLSHEEVARAAAAAGPRLTPYFSALTTELNRGLK